MVYAPGKKLPRALLALPAEAGGSLYGKAGLGEWAWALDHAHPYVPPV